MKEVRELLDEAQAAIDAQGAEIYGHMDEVRRLARPLREASDWLSKRSIETRIGNKAWQNDGPTTYYTGEGDEVGEALPPASSEYDSDVWTQLTEAQGRAIVEEKAGVKFDNLLEEDKAVRSGIEKLRRDVLANLEPLVPEPEFESFGQDLADVRAERVAISPGEIADKMGPSHFILDANSLDRTRIASPLHVANAVHAMAADQNADTAERMLAELKDLARKMRNRAKLSSARSARQPPKVDGAQSPPLGRSVIGSLALCLIWIAIGAAGFAAALDAGWFGSDGLATAAKAITAALLVAAAADLLRELVLGTERRFAWLLTAFLAGLAVSGVVFQSAS